MDRIKDLGQHAIFSAKLQEFSTTVRAAPGIANSAARSSLAAQLVDSSRRIEFLQRIAASPGLPTFHTPYSGAFEPLRGASALMHKGETDEAFWLTYLATHFGKHREDRWNLLEDVYGRLGQGGAWDWATASTQPQALEAWFGAHAAQLKQGRKRRFSNHRKYETLKVGANGAGAALRSYIDWIAKYGSHTALIASMQHLVGQNPQAVFAELYKELSQVQRLGRLGKFDLLCNLSNLMIAPIFPDKSYIADSTGPLAGAKLFFGSGLNRKDLETACVQLAQALAISPQMVEDSLCNWQKSQFKYRFFRG